MVLRSAVETPVHLQWDPDSRLPSPDPGTAPNNCGPTSVVNIAHFYTDRAYGIYATRRIAVTDDTRGTSVNEQREMLQVRGVPCYISQPPMWAIHDYIKDGDRPILAGLDMSRVPESIAGHPFRGKHAVEFLKTSWRNEGRSRGVLVRDPNFNRTYRQDPTDGQRWYPDWVIEAAMVNAGMWAVVPERPKRLDPETPDESSGRHVDGDPFPMKFRSVDYARTVRENKPIRAGIPVNSEQLDRTDSRRSYDIIGRIPVEWVIEKFPDEKQYGDVLMTRFYTGSGHVIGYIKQVDLAGGE